MGNKELIGIRLKEERERLGYSQSAFAALVGVTRKTLFGYESAERFPAGDALAAWFDEGLDVTYVLSGERSNRASTHHLPADEQLLLETYRGMPAKARKELLAGMLMGGKRAKIKPGDGVSVSGNNNRTAGGTYHENKE